MIPDVAHNSMLEVRWQSVADSILGWLQARLSSSSRSLEPIEV